ncbi:MAG: hypothetical protein JNJ59_09520 [Deltaproteobacteria bacterium]|nr:hypothetical protein [Deltaproteobacteria bacterium]
MAEAAASDNRIQGAEAELAAVLRWLRAHPDATIELATLALSASDHRTNEACGAVADDAAIEVRADILARINAAAPLGVYTRVLLDELEYVDIHALEEHLLALVDAGLVAMAADGWRLAEGTDDEACRAGWRVLAARSVLHHG